MKYHDLQIHAPHQSKLALVTGGTGVLGSATSKLLAQRGWNVIVHYNSNGQRATELVEELSNHRVKARPWQCDLRTASAEHLSNSLKPITQDLGEIDSFVHCTGLAISSQGFDAAGAAEFLKEADLNVGGFLKVLEMCLTGMKYRQHGAIVGVLSEAILPPGVPGWSAYAAAKTALAWYLEDLACRVGNMGIGVYGVLPGLFSNHSIKSALPGENHWPMVSPL